MTNQEKADEIFALLPEVIEVYFASDSTAFVNEDNCKSYERNQLNAAANGNMNAAFVPVTGQEQYSTVPFVPSMIARVTVPFRVLD